MKILEDECSIIENTSDIIVIKYDDRLLTNELALSYKTALLCKERPTSELATVCLSSATSRHCVRMSVKAVNDFVCRRVQQLYHRLYRCCFLQSSTDEHTWCCFYPQTACYMKSYFRTRCTFNVRLHGFTLLTHALLKRSYACVMVWLKDSRRDVNTQAHSAA